MAPMVEPTKGSAAAVVVVDSVATATVIETSVELAASLAVAAAAAAAAAAVAAGAAAVDAAVAAAGTAAAETVVAAACAAWVVAVVANSAVDAAVAGMAAAGQQAALPCSCLGLGPACKAVVGSGQIPSKEAVLAAASWEGMVRIPAASGLASALASGLPPSAGSAAMAKVTVLENCPRPSCHSGAPCALVARGWRCRLAAAGAAGAVESERVPGSGVPASG